MSFINWIITNWIMVVGVLTGGGSVLFLALNRAKIGWLLGIINAVFFVILMAKYHLYADVTLNTYYFFTSAAGLFWWLKGGKAKTPLKIQRLSKRGWIYVGIAAIIGTLTMGWALATFTAASIPYIDTFTTVLSFIGQFLLARKFFENWYIWIAADVIDIGIYMFKGLPLVAALTVVYIVLCVAGIIKWRKIEREENVFDDLDNRVTLEHRDTLGIGNALAVTD